MTVQKTEGNMKYQALQWILLLCVVRRIAAAEEYDYKSTTISLGNRITSKMKPHIAAGTTQLINNFIYPGTRVEKLRRQKIFPSNYPFPCKNSTWFGRSADRPRSVHKLRPGDIDVVGAMGDSLVAGNGALEEYAMGTVIEYRGVSWCAGGDATWRQYLTLPNILKEYNPNLKGYSTGKGEFLSKNSGLNVAFPVSADADALMQAKYLVRKIKSDQQIDFKNDWKMITLFFGANNLCSAQCFNKEGTSAIEHRNKLMEALDYLHANLPRTFVNLIPVLDVSVSVRQKRSMMCRFLHRFFCMCFHTGRDVKDEFEIITQLVRDYQEAEDQLINSGRYDTKEDFTVVLQPFMKAFNAPKEESAKFKPFIDESYITYDCFHFSQKGHALGDVQGILFYALPGLTSLAAVGIRVLSIKRGGKYIYAQANQNAKPEVSFSTKDALPKVVEPEQREWFTPICGMVTTKAEINPECPIGANMLWNNLLEPVGAKSMKKLDYVMEKFRCPTQKSPYFFTKRNSLQYVRTGSQIAEKIEPRRFSNYPRLTAEYINSELGFDSF